jgi:DNA mismatch repair protein MutS
VEVAKLAGLPGTVINRAREILAELENGDGRTVRVVAPAAEDDQISMLDMRSQQVCAALESITVETLTPIEAMNELYKLKRMLNA